MGSVGLIDRRSNGAAATILGSAPEIAALRSMVGRVAQSDASVMITGPSGSGKEVVASAIHAASHRANKPFVAINCGAIPHDLIESELFGHERGSFTGANARRIGRFEEASGGTLFLDEIGDMRFDMQVKLLRVLETGTISRIGGGTPIPVDVRIICATHQDIHSAIEDGRFREDLYFRLCVVPLATPSLACRTADIPILIDHFQSSRRVLGKAARFRPDAIVALERHSWPGNVRELRNVVERASVLFPGEAITAAHVDQLLGRARHDVRTVSDLGRRTATATVLEVVAPTETEATDMPVPTTAIPIDLKSLLETMELERIQMALDVADGVISEAARLLTLKRTTLIEKMRKYGVDKQC